MSSFLSTPGAEIISTIAGPALTLAIAGKGPFRTQPASTPEGIYGIALRAPTPPYIPVFLYVFGLGPQQIERGVMGLGNFYDVQGQPSNFGVNRIPDIYGQSPPIYRVAGTTGVKYHSRDQFLFSGLQSVIILSSVISQYYALNAQQAANGNSNLYGMEFYDFYLSQFWQVVPLGPQRLLQDVRRGPQLVYYDITLVGVASLEQPIGPAVDNLFSNLASNVQAALTSSQATTDSLTQNYALSMVVNGTQGA